jgi:tRNA pseudouridine38-40 synthase
MLAMRIALGIEYDGGDFAGWQLQEGGVRTVQGNVERALSQVADHPVRVVCAGRTDAGVHATAQVVHFDTDAERGMRSWVHGANANLPKTVSVQWARTVADDFHARFSAVRRRYRYVILNREIRPSFLDSRVVWEYRPLNESLMQQAAQSLVGEHDFSAYRAMACQAKSPVRNLYDLSVNRDRDLLILDLEANAFLHHMVRNIAGVLMDIGAGKQSPGWAREVLESRDRTLGGVTAPPHGLYLTCVSYPAHIELPPLSPSGVVW